MKSEQRFYDNVYGIFNRNVHAAETNANYRRRKHRNGEYQMAEPTKAATIEKRFFRSNS